MNYNSDFKYDLEAGKKTEQLLGSILENDKIEVKDDSAKSAKTGNVFVEFESRGKSSGIASSQADWWAIKTSEDSFVIVSAKKLKELSRKYYKLNRIVRGGDNNTSIGVLIPREELI